MCAIPQEVLVPPTRAAGEENAAWRQRYRAAYEELLAHIRALPAIVFSPGSTPTWLGDPNVIMLKEERGYRILTFQLNGSGRPHPLVQSVNFRLALRYHDRAVPWARPSIAQLCWWFQIHPELGVIAPVEVLGTQQEVRLVDLATDRDSLMFFDE